MPAKSLLTRALRSGLLALATAVSGLCLTQGALAQVGNSGAARAPTQQGNKPTPSTRWETVRGQAADLAINPKGDIFALDRNGGLWRLPADEAKSAGSGWRSQPGRYKRVRATLDGAMWAITPDDFLYRLQGSVWLPVLGPVRDIAAAPDGQALILTMEGKVFDLQTALLYMPPPPEAAAPAVTLVVDAHGLPWLQREDRSVVRFDGTAWQTVASARDQLAMVTAGFDGGIMGVAADGQIARYDARRNAWQVYGTEGQALPPMRQIALSPNGLPWGISRGGDLLAERPIGVPPPVAASPSAFTRLLSWQNTNKQSAAVSVGQDGTTYAIGPDGSLWRRKRGLQWLQVRVDGQVKAIASGTEGRAWGLTDKGNIVQFDGGFQVPLTAPGQVRLLAAGPKGTLYAVASADDLFRWNAASRQWERVMKLPAAPAAISIGVRGEPWFVDEKGAVRSQNLNGEWTTISGIQATSVSVGPEGTVYATSSDEGVYWLDKGEQRWKPASGKAVQIAVGPGGAPWAITAKNELLMSGRVPDEPATREPTQTASRRAPATTTTASSSTETSTTQSTSTSSSSTTAGTTDTPISSPSAFVVVPPGATGPTLGVPGATSPSGYVSGPVMVVGSTSGFTVTGPRTATTKPLSYQTITSDARFNDIGIGSNGTIFAVSTDGGLMCFNNAAGRFILASSGIASRVAVAPDGMPWVLDTNGRVSRFDKQRAAWRIVPNFTGVDISFGPDGQLWGASSGGAVFRYNVAADSFDVETVTTSDLSFRARRVAGANSRVYWVIAEQGQLLRCEKGDCKVQLLGATDAAVAPDNTVFALDLLGNVMRYDATKKLFEKQNGLGSSIAVGPGGLPWLVTPTGKIDSSGPLALNSKTINSPDCATVFATAPAPLPPPPSVVLVANADSATLAPGASLDLLSNDTFAGRAANIADVTVSLENASSLLALSGGSVVVSTTATAGAVLTGTYRICPRNVTGNCVASTVSVTVSGTSTAPTAVTAVGGDRQATISFTAPGVGGVSSYSVTSSQGNLTANGTTSPITILGLTNGTQYSFTVTAKFTNGTSKTSDASNTIIPSATITEPGAPTIGTASAGNAHAMVSFTAPSSNGGAAITSYTVSSFPGGIQASGTTSPITITGLTNGTAYTFTVRAQNSIGLGAPSAASNSVTPSAAPVVAAATVPGAPTGISPNPVITFGVPASPPCLPPDPIGGPVCTTAGPFPTPGQLDIVFTPPASDGGSAITSYTVTATGTGGPFIVSGPASPITLTGLITGQSYTISVTATNLIGTGAAGTVGPLPAP